MSSSVHPASARQSRESAILAVLAAVQFTSIMDFMIMMPLGPEFMRVFHITPGQFGFLVSTYSFAAGITGFLAGFWMDRFDRKRALLILYAGFALGTFCCALAPNYGMLMAARIVAGGFGGVAGSVVLAIVGDVFPHERRGQAMGVIMTGFSLASIFGLPIGLKLSSWLGWHAPFFLLAGMSAVILIAAYRLLPSLPAHAHTSTHDAWENMRVILTHSNHLRAFVLIAVLTSAGALIYPFLSPSMVSNAGLPEDDLLYIYAVGGLAAFFTSRYFGLLSDRHGKLRMFTWLALLSAIPTLAVTLLTPSPIWLILTVTTFFMVLTTGRFVPGMAMITSSVEARYRGGFMSVNSAVQQFAAALATAAASSLVANDAAGRLTGYGRVGVISVVLIVAAVFLARLLRVAKGSAPTAAASEHAMEAMG